MVYSDRHLIFILYLQIIVVLAWIIYIEIW